MPRLPRLDISIRPRNRAPRTSQKHQPHGAAEVGKSPGTRGSTLLPQGGICTWLAAALWVTPRYRSILSPLEVKLITDQPAC